ncbi:hypothetical protein VTK56DRAFT_5965 [Thermocarpiscus australiensis]
MLTVESLFNSSFLGQLRAIIQMPSSQDNSVPLEREPSAKSKSQSLSAQPCRRPRTRITRPEPGSLYDIMHDHAGTSLYVIPICWTDLHSRLLGAHFAERPAIVKPVPNLATGRWLEPSTMAQKLTAELHTLVQQETSPTQCFRRNRAIKHVMSTLFPSTLSRPKSSAELNLYFGQRVFRKVVRVPCIWRSPSSADTSFDSAPTLPSTSFTPVPKGGESVMEYAPNKPILAYLSKGALAAIRKNLYGAARGPGNTPNEPVARLQRLRSKMLIPANVDHDPYIVAVLLAMAQAHFYHEPSSRQSSQSQSGSRCGRKPIRMPPPSFRDVKVQLITHDEGNDSSPNFIVYTAVVTVTFLKRFMFPHKAPISEDGRDFGMEITYTPVSFWPVLGLKERLAKALGREIAGDPMDGDPDHIGLWDSLLEPQPRPVYAAVTAKRKRADRTPLLEVLNSSFEEEPPSSPDDLPVLSPSTKRRKTARPVNPLQVC